MFGEDFGELLPYRQRGIEGFGGILEDHRNAIAPDAPQVTGRETQQVKGLSSGASARPAPDACAGRTLGRYPPDPAAPRATRTRANDAYRPRPEQYSSACVSARRHRHEPEQGACGDTFTRAGLAHKAQGFSFRDVEADTIDRVSDPALRMEVNGQVVDRYQRRSGPGPTARDRHRATGGGSLEVRVSCTQRRSVLGSRTSRRPSRRRTSRPTTFRRRFRIAPRSRGCPTRRVRLRRGR